MSNYQSQSPFSKNSVSPEQLDQALQEKLSNDSLMMNNFMSVQSQIMH